MLLSPVVQELDVSAQMVLPRLAGVCRWAGRGAAVRGYELTYHLVDLAYAQFQSHLAALALRQVLQVELMLQ